MCPCDPGNGGGESNSCLLGFPRHEVRGPDGEQF